MEDTESVFLSSPPPPTPLLSILPPSLPPSRASSCANSKSIASSGCPGLAELNSQFPRSTALSPDPLEILWNHFGFIPNHPDLDLDGYMLPSPLPDPLPAPPNSLVNFTQPRTSPHNRQSSLPNMTKKRRSLQAILVPSFLPQPSTSASASAISTPPSRARSHTVTSPNDLSAIEYSPDWLSFYSGAPSPRSEISSLGPVTPSRNSPPPDLLDEDPFANLSPAPSVRGSRATSPVRTVFDVFADEQDGPATPRSPLAQTATLQEESSRVLRHASSYTSFQGFSNLPSTPPPTPTEPTKPPLVRRNKSSGPPQIRPAYTRPAFAPRPSLPSLNTLTRTSIHVPKVRRGRPGAHLPLEPWEDSETAQPELSEPPSPTRSVPSSPVARRRGHIRHPTLSMIRDSRMFLDGESAEDGGMPPLEPEPEAKERSSARDTPTPVSVPRPAREAEEGVREDIGMGTSFLSISPETYRGSFYDPEQPPTPPPKSPNAPWHVRSASETSVTSTSTVPSLCPSSPSSSSFTDSQLQRTPSLPDSDSHLDTRSLSPLPELPPPHPHVHIDTEQPSYPGVFAHHRHTQLLTTDLLASLEYDYSDALSHLSMAAASGLAVPLAPSGLFPSTPPGDFQPGSSAGTIRPAPSTRIQPDVHEDDNTPHNGTHVPRVASDASADSKWSIEATDAHLHHAPPLSPTSPPELPSSSSEPSAESSPSPSPSTALSRSRSSSTVSSEYDFGEADTDEEGYSYDLGAFADPLGSPPFARPVFGYGIPWPSTHNRASSGSGGSGGSGGSVAMSDVLSDLEDLAEDLTERFSLSMQSAAQSVRSSSSGDVFSDDAPVDAPEGDGGARRNGRPSGGSSHSQSYVGASGSASNGYSGYSKNGGVRRGSANDGDEDGDDDRKRRPPRLPIPPRAAVTDSETSEDEEDSDTDDYGEGSPEVPRTRQRHDTTRPGMRAPIPVLAPPLSTSPAAISPVAATSAVAADDDVPLARQIPTALKAQRTIRRQVRDELDQKREERRAQRAQQAILSQRKQDRVERSSCSPGAQTDGVQQWQQQQQQQQPAVASTSPPRAIGRTRTKTLPSTMSSPFSVGDLTKKLLGLQTGASATAPPVPVPVSPMAPRSKRPSFDTHDFSAAAPASASALARGRTMNSEPHTYATSSRQTSRAPAEATRGLRPMRSFHRPARAADIDVLAPPVPSTERTSLSDLQRRGTTASRHRALEEPPAFLATAPPPLQPAAADARALDRARSVKSVKSTKSSGSRRPSAEKTRPEFESISSGGARARSVGPSVAQASASTFSQPAKGGAGQMMWQQRVFIGNMQRFCLVEIGSGTSAGDVLGMVDTQGALEQGAGSGGWMLWEVSQDFGMERPIRTFEMLSDVCGAWNSDKTVNMLVIKKTLLAPLLSPKAMPSASPKCSGYVQWEYKRGKWQKRWMELREHSLWLSKRDTGKDATFLCSLNNFDAYYVTRVHKAPKPYVFSVKSTDSLSFFESTADYVHVFSCGESEGKNWLEKILIARSYVLYQERNVLSSASAAPTGSSAVGGLQRSGTRKQAPGQRPAQPLVNVGAPKADPLSVPTGFEPAAGSLLARRHG